MLEVLNPATEEVVESLEPATADDADAAIARARKPSRRGEMSDPTTARACSGVSPTHSTQNRRTWPNWSRRTPASP